MCVERLGRQAQGKKGGDGKCRKLFLGKKKNKKIAWEEVWVCVGMCK